MTEQCPQCGGAIELDHCIEPGKRPGKVGCGWWRLADEVISRSGTERAAPDGRDLVLAAEEAESAMLRFAELLQAWNAPDDEHTRFQLQAVLDSVLRETLGDA